LMAMMNEDKYDGLKAALDRIQFSEDIEAHTN
jgi:hypothetical protein